MTVNVDADPDIALVSTAKTIIEGGSYTMTQATANSETALKAELVSQINALTGMSGTGITVTGSAITLSSFMAAVSGASGSPSGTNGSFTFTVALTKGVVNDTTTGKSGTITATAYTGGSGGSNGGGAIVTSPVKPEGTIEKVQQKAEGAPEANLNNSITELKADVFTSEEQKKLEAGEDAKLTLKVENISASVGDSDKKLVEEKIKSEQPNSEQQNSEQQNKETTVLYIDISLYKQIGNEAEIRVTETSNKISISIQVPDEMLSAADGYNRTYRVVRVHNGVVEFLDGTYDPETHLFTFETDRFSVYALTYQDTKNATDNTATSISDSDQDKITAYHDFSHLRLTAVASKNVQKLSYAKVSGADGYLIYGAQCGQELKELADVEKTVTGYTDENLKPATYYKYQVKAYKIIDGEKVIIATSELVRSVTASKTYGNPTKITTKLSSVTLAAGNTKKVTYQLVLPDGKRMKDYASLIRFESTDTKIATISSNGKITAISKGSCYVYVYAQNGVYAKIKIIVE
jgi:hypothetical protein